MSEYRLEMRGVCKSFPGVKALDNAQLKLRPGTVHAFDGRKWRGESTLMKCMFGIYKMDEAKFSMRARKSASPILSRRCTWASPWCIRNCQPIPERSVAENVFVGRYPTKRVLGFRIVDHAKMYQETERVLKEVRMNFNPRQRLGELSVSQMQSVEIAKALYVYLFGRAYLFPDRSGSGGSVSYHRRPEKKGRLHRLYQP